MDDDFTLTANELEAVQQIWRRWSRPDVRMILRRSSPSSGAALRIELSPTGFNYNVQPDGKVTTGAGREPTWLQWAELAA